MQLFSFPPSTPYFQCIPRASMSRPVSSRKPWVLMPTPSSPATYRTEALKLLKRGCQVVQSWQKSETGSLTIAIV